jgi:hypothetical protein
LWFQHRRNNPSCVALPYVNGEAGCYGQALPNTSHPERAESRAVGQKRNPAVAAKVQRAIYSFVADVTEAIESKEIVTGLER